MQLVNSRFRTQSMAIAVAADTACIARIIRIAVPRSKLEKYKNTGCEASIDAPQSSQTNFTASADARRNYFSENS